MGWYTANPPSTHLPSRAQKTISEFTRLLESLFMPQGSICDRPNIIPLPTTLYLPIEQSSSFTNKEKNMWPSPPFLFPPLESTFVAALSALSVVSGAAMGISELRGENMAYSKFSHLVAAASSREKERGAGALLPSRAGMLVAYAPALVAVAVSFAVPGAVNGRRARLLTATLALHFLKRVLEVSRVQHFKNNKSRAAFSR